MENVQETSKQSGRGAEHQHGVKAQPKRRRLAKTHVDYWKSRLFRNTYTREGVLCEVNELSVKIQHLGKRHTFPLGVGNKDVAAVKARDIYAVLVANGWDAALAKHNPEMVQRQDDDPAVLCQL